MSTKPLVFETFTIKNQPLTMKEKSSTNDSGSGGNGAITVGDLIGGWGPYQWNIFIFDLTVQMSTMANILSMSFMAPKVDFYCFDNVSSLDQFVIPSSSLSSSNSYNSTEQFNGLGSCDFKGIYNNETSSQ